MLLRNIRYNKFLKEISGIFLFSHLVYAESTVIYLNERIARLAADYYRYRMNIWSNKHSGNERMGITVISERTTYIYKINYCFSRARARQRILYLIISRSSWFPRLSLFLPLRFFIIFLSYTRAHICISILIARDYRISYWPVHQLLLVYGQSLPVLLCYLTSPFIYLLLLHYASAADNCIIRTRCYLISERRCEERSDTENGNVTVLKQID